MNWTDAIMPILGLAIGFCLGMALYDIIKQLISIYTFRREVQAQRMADRLNQLHAQHSIKEKINEEER